MMVVKYAKKNKYYFNFTCTLLFAKTKYGVYVGYSHRNILFIKRF